MGEAIILLLISAIIKRLSFMDNFRLISFRGSFHGTMSLHVFHNEIIASVSVCLNFLNVGSLIFFGGLVGTRTPNPCSEDTCDIHFTTRPIIFNIILFRKIF